MCERFITGDKCMSKFKIQPVAVQSHRLFNPTLSVAELAPGYLLPALRAWTSMPMPVSIPTRTWSWTSAWTWTRPRLYGVMPNPRTPLREVSASVHLSRGAAVSK